MKSTSAAWFAAVNLMAGLAAVLVVLLAMVLMDRPPAVLPLPARVDAPAAAVMPAQVLDAPLERPGARRTGAVLQQMQSAFAQQGASSYVAIDADTGKVTLKERAFRSGSACIEPQARAALIDVQAQIAAYLAQFPGGRIYVEGHTDDKPVKSPVTDTLRFCAVYDDNVTLSAARARQARLLLVGGADGQAAKRVIVAGYGDSQPLPGSAADDQRNRRVELRFVSAAAAH